MSYFEANNLGQKHRPGPRERELLLEREKERERYNRMVQGQGIYRDRRRCMALSPTRLQTRSPHLQFIHRGRANILFATTSPTASGNNGIATAPPGQDQPQPQPQPLPTHHPTAPIPFSSTSSSSSSSSSPPSSASAISPDIEPIFQMSPVAVHCLPPLRNTEPINVMTLRNCAGPHPHASNARSRLRPGKSTRAAVPPLLYTFPRPNPNPNPNPNSNININNNDNNNTPKPKKENSISQLASIKKPFGLVSQNQNPKTPEQFSSEIEPETPSLSPLAPSSLFLDLSITPHPPPPPPSTTNKHIRIALPHDKPRLSHDPWMTHQQSPTKRKSRALTPIPIPSSKVLDTPKPVLTNLTVSRTTRLASPIPFPTIPSLIGTPPLKRIPSLPIPIPYHTPRKEDTGLFEDVSVNGSRDDDDGDDRADDLKFNTARATRKNINDTAATRRLNDDGNDDDDDDRIQQDHIQSNCLGLGLPFSPPPLPFLPSDNTPSQILSPLQLHPARFSIPTGNFFHYPVPVPVVSAQCITSSSLSPKLGFALEESCDIDNEGAISDSVEVWAERHREQSDNLQTRVNTSARKRRSGSKEVELTNAEYFENSVDPVPDPESSFVPAFSQRFESLEPVFPAFSIAQSSDLNFGQGMDNSCLQFIDSDRRASVAVDSENVFTAEQDSEPNPWLSSTFSSNSTNRNSNTGSSPSPSPDSTFRTFPQSNSNFAQQSQPAKMIAQTKFRNGKANLNVFNPPQMPPFGDPLSMVSNSTNSTESSGYGSGSSGSSGSDQFLSFPIPIFNPNIPYAAPSAITNVLVRLPGSLSPGSRRNRNRSRNGSGGVMTASESESLPIPAQEHESLHFIEEKGTLSSSSYRSSDVYDGCRSIPQAAGAPSRSPYWQTPVSSSISPPLRQNPQAFLRQTVEMRYPTPTPTPIPTPTRVNSPKYKEGRRKGRLTLGF